MNMNAKTQGSAPAVDYDLEMITEAHEVADSLVRLARLETIRSFDDALAAVRRELPGESEIVINNVAWALWKNQ